MAYECLTAIADIGGAGADMADTFHRLVPAESLVTGVLRAFEVTGWPVAVVRLEAGVHAFFNRCSHAGAELAPCGRIRARTVVCPLHGARFDLGTGASLGGLTSVPILVFPVRETTDGWIEVALPDGPPPGQ